MLSCLSRRGPDDTGVERLPGAILGQTRLAIVDLSPAGHQPMKDNERPLTVVFNGEIYGYSETRKDLEARGHRFSSHSDTEVILKAYAEYGERCVDHLDGMFAFALWDDEKEQLFVARDRFGKKPFYYAWHESTFYAASEMKSLFATGLFKGQVDPGALDDFLRLLYMPPHRTVYANIHTLPPAHAGVVKDGALRSWRYWQLEKQPSAATYAEAKAEVRRLFDKAVEKRMIADVEVGSLLSGGVDSTMVTATAQRFSASPIKTFAVGYGAYRSELPYAEQAARQIGTDHYELVAPKADMQELRAVIEYFDEPHADSSDFPQALVSKLASSKVKVALSGDGADELFMGYGWYQKFWHTPRWKKIFRDPYSSYVRATEVFSGRERKKLLHAKRVPTAFERTVVSRFADPFDKINAFDISVYLPGQLLSKVDRSGMMHSLEVRSPFLDTALAEYVFSLPRQFKLSASENKILLKDLLAETFPREFVYRRKQGFGAPIQEWMKEPDVRREILRLLSRDDHPMFAYIDKDEARKILASAESLGKGNAQKAWSLLCLALWFELHQKRHG